MKLTFLFKLNLKLLIIFFSFSRNSVYFPFQLLQLLVILFPVKLHTRINTFKRIKSEKHTQEVLELLGSMEGSKRFLMMIETGILFVKTCQIKQRIPKFAKVKL